MCTGKVQATCFLSETVVASFSRVAIMGQTSWTDWEHWTGNVRIIASAGRHQTCLPSWRKESSARVYARYVCSEIVWAQKS